MVPQIALNPVSTARCPICGGNTDQEPVSCPRCETLYHRECWEWSQACAIYGCVERPATVPVPSGQTQSPPAVMGRDELVHELGPGAFTSNRMTTAAVLRPFYWITAVGMFSLFGLNGVNFIIFPLILAGGRWRFDPDRQRLSRVNTFAGIRVSEESFDFDQILRVEVANRSGFNASLILSDGSSCSLSGLLPVTAPKKKLQLMAFLRGVQAHTPIHVTENLRKDPLLAGKRLETLKMAALTAAPRMDLMRRVSIATVMVMLVLTLVRAIHQPVYAILSAVLGIGLLAMGRVAADPDPLGLAQPGGAIPLGTVTELQQELDGMYPRASGMRFAIFGQLLLLAAAYVPTLNHRHAAVPAMVIAALGSLHLCYTWSRGVALRKAALKAELLEGPPVLTKVTPGLMTAARFELNAPDESAFAKVCTELKTHSVNYNIWLTSAGFLTAIGLLSVLAPAFKSWEFYMETVLVGFVGLGLTSFRLLKGGLGRRGALEEQFRTLYHQEQGREPVGEVRVLGSDRRQELEVIDEEIVALTVQIRDKKEQTWHGALAVTSALSALAIRLAFGPPISFVSRVATMLFGSLCLYALGCSIAYLGKRLSRKTLTEMESRKAQLLQENMQEVYAASTRLREKTISTAVLSAGGFLAIMMVSLGGLLTYIIGVGDWHKILTMWLSLTGQGLIFAGAAALTFRQAVFEIWRGYNHPETLEELKVKREAILDKQAGIQPALSAGDSQESVIQLGELD